MRGDVVTMTVDEYAVGDHRRVKSDFRKKNAAALRRC
jgi:hypothetical protein